MVRTWLIDIRKSHELTHDMVAKQSQIKRQYYGMIESGVRDPSVAVAKRIADVLNFDWTLFFKQEGNELLQEKTSSA